MTAQLAAYISEEGYLEGEKRSEVRDEYFDGEVFEMAGASTGHELVAGNFFIVLGLHLRGKGCRVFKGDMKLRMPPFHGRGLYYYPDVMVACDPADNQNYFRERPKLVIEVLSADEDQDWIKKALMYRRLRSLEEYAIADPDPAAPAVHISRRADGWEPVETFTGMDAKFTLLSVDLTLQVSDLFLE